MSESRQKVALITGASSGIGFAVSKELALKGWKVYAGARRTEMMAPLKEFGVVPITLDVASKQSRDELKEVLTKELVDGQLDVLYNNAGISCTSPAIDVSDERLESAFAVNVFAPIQLTRDLQDFVIAAKGTILFTGSIAGTTPFPFSSVYCSTKAAIHAYARVLHLEMKGFGVRVINVVTGGVQTDIADKHPKVEGSKFDCEAFDDAFESRRTMAKNNKPMTAEAYAKEVVGDILSSRDPIDVYRGKLATIMGYLPLFAPGFITEYFLAIKFKLNPIFAYLRKKYSGDELHLD